MGGGGGNTMVSIAASGSRCPRFNFLHSKKKFRRKFLMLLRLINSAALGKMGSGLKFFYQTHLVLASGKLVLQKDCIHSS